MLRLEIDGIWEPEDFVESLKALESLYYKAIMARLEYPFIHPFTWTEYAPIMISPHAYADLANEWLLVHGRNTIQSDLRLTVSRIEYGSPGLIDLIGGPKFLEAIASMIEKFVGFISDRALRREREKQAELETKRKEIELEKEQISLRYLKIEQALVLMKVGRVYPEVAEHFLIDLFGRDQDKLIHRITEGKIVGAKTVADEASDRSSAE